MFVLRTAVTLFRFASNQESNEWSVGREGGGGISRGLRASSTLSQFIRHQFMDGGGVISSGGLMSMRMGTWSDPVDGSVVRQLDTNGESVLDAKARSRTPGSVEESKGYLVYTPGSLTRL